MMREDVHGMGNNVGWPHSFPMTPDPGKASQLREIADQLEAELSRLPFAPTESQTGRWSAEGIRQYAEVVAAGRARVDDRQWWMILQMIDAVEGLQAIQQWRARQEGEVSP